MRPCRPLFALVVVAALASACTGVRVTPVGPVELPEPPQTSMILARDGSVLARLHADEHREVVPLARVPQVLRDAVVAVEDTRFPEHPGVDARAVARAALANARAGIITQGGSTITQQLAKNALTGDEPTLERKVAEARIALALEQRYSKDEILERYLNSVYFGHGAYGVATAARRYFGVEVDALDLPQSALLVALLKSPSRYDPYTHPARARDRRDLVLERMAVAGLLGTAEATAARAAPIVLAPLEPPAGRAAWFVDHVAELLRTDPAFAALGADAQARQDRLDRGGLRVETTLDGAWQQAAEAAVAATLPDPRDPHAALVAIDPATGEVRALVGGRGALAEGRFNLATDAARQPGSTFKPLVLAAALARGHTLDERHPGGARVTVPDPDGRAWTVTNHEQHDPGPLSLGAATAASVNTVYARVITDVGPQAVAETARAAGITRDLAPLPSLALGAQEVSVLEMASVQATLAAGGVARPPSFVRRIVGPDGAVLYERGTPPAQQVMAPGTAWLVTAALRRAVTEGTGQRAGGFRPVAGKTGTTDDGADAWFTGYTPELAAAVWVGFPEGRVPMEPPRTRIRVEGGTWPAELFARFTLRALAEVPVHDFPRSGTVPDVLGLPTREAQQQLERAGLVPAVAVACPGGAPACNAASERPGRVWEQSPDGGSPAAPGQRVQVHAYPRG